MKSSIRALAFALVALVASGAESPAPAAAAGATPKPFGKLACAPADGWRKCEGDLDTRVRSWDGVPLDVNVALPARGDGPFPLVVQLHGWGGSKVKLEQARPWARAGYAVLQYTARGFGLSCGKRESRQADPEGCAEGWIRLADSRYEVRDTQHLAGLLADQRLVHPRRIGVTGVSYGGGQSLQLAMLRDRVRRPDGSLVPWRSPRGRRMRIAATAPIIPWSDLAYSLVPNGRTLDYAVTDRDDNLAPVGVVKTTYVAGLFAAGLASGYYSPPGRDRDADLTTWYALVNAGEPYEANPFIRDVIDEIATNHSAYYLPLDRVPAPTFISNGWTDDLFPVDEAVRWANRVHARFPRATIAQMHFDYGHMRGQRNAENDADQRRLRSHVRAFFDRHVKGRRVAAPTGVEALPQVCGDKPLSRLSGGPFRARNWAALRRGEVRWSTGAARTVVSASANPAAGAVTDPIAGRGACARLDARDTPGAATYVLPAVKSGYTLLGSPTVVADLTVAGPSAALAARLWDVAPDGRQTLVARAVYRPQARGRQVFQLHPNAWRFAAGHRPKLELLSRDAPYARPTNTPWQIGVGDLELRLPTWERRGAGISRPGALPLPRGAVAARGVRTTPLTR